MGPLEFVVIRIKDAQFAGQILPALAELQRAGNVQVVDLLSVVRDANGTVNAREARELSDETSRPFGDLAYDLQGLLTLHDIATLATDVPVTQSAVIVMLEHSWAQALGRAVSQAGGMVLGSGLVPVDTLARVNLELSAIPA